MQINLKKSAALQAGIREAIKDLDLETTAGISIFVPEVQTAILDAEKVLMDAIGKRAGLNAALFEIREATGAANATSGVDALLVKTAQLKSEIEFLSVLASANIRDDVEVTKGKIERMLREVPAQDRRYGAQPDEVRVGLITAEGMEKIKGDLRIARRNAVDLKDRLLEVNIATRITLSEETVKVLSDAGLI